MYWRQIDFFFTILLRWEWKAKISSNLSFTCWKTSKKRCLCHRWSISIFFHNYYNRKVLKGTLIDITQRYYWNSSREVYVALLINNHQSISKPWEKYKRTWQAKQWLYCFPVSFLLVHLFIVYCNTDKLQIFT